MKAIIHAGHGGSDQLKLVEVAEPTVGAGEILIAVHRSGVNYADLSALHTGNNFLGAKPQDRIPGGEVVGRRYDTGRRVVAICGSGGYAEKVAAPEAQVFEVPDDIDDEVAAALFIQGLTAWHVVTTMGRLAAGESVLIHSAAGGVGSLAVQIARALGAGRIVATASTADKRDVALASGASVAIDATEDGLNERALTANHGARFDLVLDRSGGNIFSQSLAITAPFGRVVCYGTSSGKPGELLTTGLIAGSRTLSGFWLMDALRDRGFAQSALHKLFDLYRQGALKPQIGLVLPLHAAAEAHRAIAEHRTTGKVLLDAMKGQE
jgi:NADPH:quinone reductase